jgi:hypothetical protein
MTVTKKRAGLPRLAASRVPLGTKPLRDYQILED